MLGKQQYPARNMQQRQAHCRMLLPEATRAWREGVPTVIVMETGYHLDNTSKAFREGIPSHHETFADYPDLKDRYFKLGDMRYNFTRMHMCMSLPCYL